MAACSTATGRPVRGSRPRSSACRSPTTAATRSPTCAWASSATARSTAIHSKIMADMGAYPCCSPRSSRARGVRDERVLQDPRGPDRHRRRVHQQGADRRHPRRRAARGDAHDRGDDRPGGRTSWGWTGSSCGARTSSPKEDFPATTALGIVYDSGDYHGALDLLLQHFDLDRLQRRAGAARNEGRYLGVGFSTYTEICGLAPSRARRPERVGLQAGLWESAMVRVHLSGAVDGLHGHLAARPGPRDGLRPDRRGPARHRPGAGGGHPRRHGARARRAWAPTAPGRSPSAARRSSAPSRRCRTRCGRSSRHQLEAAPEDIELATASSRSRARPTRA